MNIVWPNVWSTVVFLIACAFLLIAPFLQFTKQAKYKTDKIFRNRELVNVLSGVIALAAVVGTVYLIRISNIEDFEFPLISYSLVSLAAWLVVACIYVEERGNVLDGAPLVCLLTGIIGAIAMAIINPAYIWYMLGTVILGVLFLIWIRVIK